MMIGLGGAAAVGRAVGVSEVGLAADVVALSGGAGRVARHPKSAAPASAPHTATLVANTLIREGFFQSPNILRGTSSS
jgi:hypothetical protein